MRIILLLGDIHLAVRTNRSPSAKRLAVVRRRELFDDSSSAVFPFTDHDVAFEPDVNFGGTTLRNARLRSVTLSPILE